MTTNHNSCSENTIINQKITYNFESSRFIYEAVMVIKSNLIVVHPINLVNSQTQKDFIALLHRKCDTYMFKGHFHFDQGARIKLNCDLFRKLYNKEVKFTFHLILGLQDFPHDDISYLYANETPQIDDNMAKFPLQGRPLPVDVGFGSSGNRTKNW
jgi:hypothetical protein